MSDAESKTDALIKEALKLHQENALDQALSLYQEVLEVEPDHLQALIFLGVLYCQRGDPNSGIEKLQRAVDVQPFSPDAFYNLGNAFHSLGRILEAEGAYRRAIELRPGYAEACNNLANLLLDRGERQEACSMFQKAIEGNPDYVYALFNLGNVLFDLGDKSQAAVSYRRALEKDPEFTDAYRNLARLFAEQGRFAEAVEEINRALKHAPDHAGLFYQLGNFYRDQAKPDEAREAYHKVLQLEPDNEQVRHILEVLSAKNPEIAPAEYVKDLFNPLAVRFDRHLLGNLRYRAHRDLRDLFEEHVSRDPKLEHALDLGCGTGLSGLEFRGFAEKLTGVDLAENMVKQASSKNIYDTLKVADIVQFLSESDETFNLVVSTDVFIYIGNLEPVFKQLVPRIAEGGWFLFSLEQGSETEFKAQESGRYCHSNDYIHRLAKEFGFEVLARKDSVLRFDGGNPITGGVYILKKL